MNISTADFIEFSKIYKRVMDIELCLKFQFKTSLEATFPNKMFYRLIPYLKENFKNRYVAGLGAKSRDKLNDLILSKQTEEEKLSKFIKMAYLSDLLKIITEYPAIYKDKNFNKNFYDKPVLFNDLKQNASRLKKLRNTIMHFDINNYKQNRQIYVKTLGYWEQMLNCTNGILYTLPAVEVEVNKILNLLAQKVSDFYILNDRIICDMFDELAILNGCKVEELPQYLPITTEYSKMKSVQ